MYRSFHSFIAIFRAG